MSQSSLALAQHLYEALLGRDPDAPDQANLAGFLDAGGNGAALLAGSAEAAAQAGTVYQQVLGRAASSTEIVASQGDLASGGTLAGLRGAAADSREAGLAINALYVDGLDRNASSADLTASESYLAGGGTLAGLQAMIGHSPEAAAVVQALYHGILDRAADAGDLASAAAAIGNGATQDDLLHSVATSTEEGVKLAANYQDATGQAASASDVALMESTAESNALTGPVATIAQAGPAYPFPAPDLNFDGGSISQNGVYAGGPTVAITGITPGADSGTTLSTASSAPTISGDVSSSGFVFVNANGQPVSHGAGTVAITASLLGLDLPASAFATATVDAAGDWAVTPSHSLPDATYILTPTLTYTDGTTATGTPFTLDVAAGTLHASAASLFATDTASSSVMPLLHAS